MTTFSDDMELAKFGYFNAASNQKSDYVASKGQKKSYRSISLSKLIGDNERVKKKFNLQIDRAKKADDERKMIYFRSKFRIEVNEISAFYQACNVVFFFFLGSPMFSIDSNIKCE